MGTAHFMAYDFPGDGMLPSIVRLSAFSGDGDSVA